MSITNLYREEIQSEIGSISKMPIGSEDYKAAISGVTQLTDRLVKLEEIDVERQKVAVEQEKTEIEKSKAADEQKDRSTRNRLTVASIVVPAWVTGLGAAGMWLFEERGTIITSQAGRKIYERFFRMK